MIDQYDEQLIYCRTLGHEIPFSYCRKPGQELFCRKIRDCWFKKFDITSFLNEHFSKEQIEQALSPPKQKMSSLMELVAQAKQRTADN